MSACPCGSDTGPFPALWVTSTNPAIECCSPACARRETDKQSAGSYAVLDTQVRAERDARDETRRAS